MRTYFKVVSQPRKLFKSCRIQKGPLALTYKIGKWTKAKAGGIFVFSTIEDAHRFINEHSPVFPKDKYLVLEVEAEEDVTDSKDQPFVFWERIADLKRLEDYDYFVRQHKMLNLYWFLPNNYPAGTFLFKRVRPIKIL